MKAQHATEGAPPARDVGQLARGNEIARVRLVDGLARNPFGVGSIAEFIDTKGKRRART